MAITPASTAGTSNTNPEFSQDRSMSLTVTFSEESKGWICFKSFIQDNGLSLNNDYYTIKDGGLWKHHHNETRNNFYDIQEQSFVDVLFNEESATVKSFASMKYEGSQAKITQNLTDKEYYNNEEKDGWYVEFGITDIQASGKIEFKSKEGKWFSNMKGWPVKDKNYLNSEEFSFQGIDELESIVDNDDKGGGGGGGNGETNTHVCYDSNCFDINIIGASAFQNYIDNGGIPFPNLAACQASCGAPLAIGDTYQGGIIFYLDRNGGGLIAAPSDQSTVAPWGCEGILIGADKTALGTGDQNTADILAGCTDTGTSAEICDNLTLGGYSDWYLPSKDELNEMYLNRSAIGGFASSSYRSSTEYNAGTAWTQVFPAGNVYPSSKINAPHTRAIRKIII